MEEKIQELFKLNFLKGRIIQELEKGGYISVERISLYSKSKKFSISIIFNGVPLNVYTYEDIREVIKDKKFITIGSRGLPIDNIAKDHLRQPLYNLLNLIYEKFPQYAYSIYGMDFGKQSLLITENTSVNSIIYYLFSIDFENYSNSQTVEAKKEENDGSGSGTNLLPGSAIKINESQLRKITGGIVKNYE